jgi:hypothetical protein
MLHYIPTFHGDIRLEKTAEKETSLYVEKVTPLEKAALELLHKKALAKKWLAAGREFPLPSGREKVTIHLDAPIEKVTRILARALKPGRRLVSAIVFQNGEMVETSRAETKALATMPEPKAAVTVAAPTRGCPAPDFEDADLKALHVLSVFLTPAQRADALRHGAFVSVGQDTGHRYKVTSREARSALGFAGGRSLYDLDEQRAYCVHDWTVPAWEEMLALHIHLSLPGCEQFLRSIPDIGEA